MVTLSDLMRGEASSRSAALVERATTLLEAIGAVEPGRLGTGADAARACSAIDAALDGARPDLCWLALSVLSAQLADVGSVKRAVRAIRCGTRPGEVLAGHLAISGHLDSDAWRRVSVQRGGVLVDVDQASRNPLGTGIQRVVRETARRWARHPEATLVGWAEGYSGLRTLSAAETALATGSPPVADAAWVTDKPAAADPAPDSSAVLVPWRCTLVVPELAVEASRPDALGAIARFARCSTGFVGYDCVPLTMAETAVDGMPAAYMRYLAACAHATRVAAISQTAALEFKAWRSTLASRGIRGPEIQSVELATDLPATDLPATGLPAGRRPEGGISAGGVPAAEMPACDAPVVVVVGSHEPRKNHMAVLSAAELLWRRGESFALVFLGGNSWRGERFFERVDELRAKGRSVQTLSAPPDQLVWSYYRQAACSVFVSLHEGFGLPVVESLALGTPVITSRYGALADNARHGGCLLVDPRDPHQIAAAIARVLADGDLRAGLRRQAAAVPKRSWDAYADAAWGFLADRRLPA